ncbi:MAG: thioredoxin [Planctomycetota bacterium]|nr:thioredoxin [Planctomycetota bacterium]
MASESVLQLTNENFEQEVEASDTPALVDFWAEWCMPCKMITPIIEELAEEYAGKLKVGKVDTDASRNVSMKFGINAIPTLILFKGGQVSKKFVGLQSKADLKTAIDEVLA